MVLRPVQHMWSNIEKIANVYKGQVAKKEIYRWLEAE
jgi:hypothetical protein